MPCGVTGRADPSVAEVLAQSAVSLSGGQVVGVLVVAAMGWIALVVNFVFKQYLPRRQEFDERQKNSEREHEQSIVSSLIAQQREDREQLYVLVNERMRALEAHSTRTSELLGKMDAGQELALRTVRSLQSELRATQELVHVLIGNNVVTPPTPTARTPRPVTPDE